MQVQRSIVLRSFVSLPSLWLLINIYINLKLVKSWDLNEILMTLSELLHFKISKLFVDI